MKITELKKQLNAMDKAELISMLCKLYKANKQFQAILDVEVCGASAEAPLIESCRKKIHAAFFGRQLSLKNARTVINDFRKASQNKESIADLTQPQFSPHQIVALPTFCVLVLCRRTTRLVLFS